MENCKQFTLGIHTKLTYYVRYLNDPAITTVNSLLRKLVPYRPAADMLDRLLYWWSKAKKIGGWVYKSKHDWYNEEDLSEWEVKQAHSGGYLETVGVQRKLMKANGAPTNHYLLDVDHFLHILADFARTTVENIRRILNGRTTTVRNRATTRSTETIRHRTTIRNTGTRQYNRRTPRFTYRDSIR